MSKNQAGLTTPGMARWSELYRGSYRKVKNLCRETTVSYESLQDTYKLLTCFTLDAGRRRGNMPYTFAAGNGPPPLHGLPPLGLPSFNGFSNPDQAAL
jgi:hypothetical protein